MVVSLHASCKYFKEILLYSNNDTLSFEEIRTNLLSKQKFNLEVHAEKGKGLSVRGESFDKGTPLNQSLSVVSPTDPIVIVESQGM